MYCLTSRSEFFIVEGLSLMLIRTSQQELTSNFAVFYIERTHFGAFVCQKRVTEDCFGKGGGGICFMKYNVYNIDNIHNYTPYLFFTTFY